MTALIFIAFIGLLAFIAAAASLLADHLAAHRRREPEPHRGQTRVGLDRRGS